MRYKIYGDFCTDNEDLISVTTDKVRALNIASSDVIFYANTMVVEDDGESERVVSTFYNDAEMLIDEG